MTLKNLFTFTKKCASGESESFSLTGILKRVLPYMTTSIERFVKEPEVLKCCKHHSRWLSTVWFPVTLKTNVRYKSVSKAGSFAPLRLFLFILQ